MKDLKGKLRRIIISETERCIGKASGQLSHARDVLKKKYLGYGYDGDDKRSERGYSTYVDRSVMEAVEWAKPGLLKVFAGTDDIIRFDPKTPNQERAAADATLYVNRVVFGREMFRLVHDVLADGLYQRVGWCIAHCPLQREQQLMPYEGLSEQQAMALLSSPDVAGTAEPDIEVEQYIGELGQPLFNIRIRKTVERRSIRLDSVPSERVILSSDASDVEHARFIAHWELRSRSDLRKEGYSDAVLEELPPYDTADDAPETVTGREVNSDSDHEDMQTLASENTLFQVWEGWVDVDVNDDGIAEKVKVTYVGDENNIHVLDWEEWPLYRAPLFAACSVPLPHQAVGLCLGDLVSDLQDVKTEITRQLLDSLALANQGELVVSEGESGAVDYDSLLSRGLGSILRMKGDAKIAPLTVNTSAAEALQALTTTESVVERRTGITARTQSLKMDTLQNTALGASIQEEAVNQRLELIARVYAETFFRPLGRYVLHLLHRYQDGAIQMQLKGRFMEFDPRQWDPDMTISVAVGLGTGSRQKQIAAYEQILKIQQALIQMLGAQSPVHLTNVIYTCSKMAEAAGLQSPERFFGTEEDARKAEQAYLKAKQQAGAQQQMDPLTKATVELEQVKAKTTAQKAQLDMQIAQQKAALEMQLTRQKLQGDTEAKAYKAQMDAQLNYQKAVNAAGIKSQEIQAKKELDMAKIQHQQAGVIF